VRDVICLLPGLAGLIASVLGCSVVVDANRVQCSTDSDCSARGAEFASSVCVQSFCQESAGWACLGDTPVAPPASTEQFRVSFLVRDAVSQKPKTGLGVRLCRKLDVECTDALSDVAMVDEQGSVAFQVEGGFAGYARFEGRSDSVPGMYFFNPPVAKDTMDIAVQLSAPETVAGLAALTGVMPDSTRGVVLLSVLDCMGAPASGVILQSNKGADEGKVFYSKAGIPDGQATMTDKAGYGGLVNATKGAVTLYARVAQSQKSVGEVTVMVQPGTQTMTKLVANGS
jgi:hypothetical protein